MKKILILPIIGLLGVMLSSCGTVTNPGASAIGIGNKATVINHYCCEKNCKKEHKKTCIKKAVPVKKECVKKVQPKPLVVKKVCEKKPQPKKPCVKKVVPKSPSREVIKKTTTTNNDQYRYHGQVPPPEAIVVECRKVLHTRWYR